MHVIRLCIKVQSKSGSGSGSGSEWVSTGYLLKYPLSTSLMTINMIDDKARIAARKLDAKKYINLRFSAQVEGISTISIAK